MAVVQLVQLSAQRFDLGVVQHAHARQEAVAVEGLELFAAERQLPPLCHSGDEGGEAGAIARTGGGARHEDAPGMVAGCGKSVPIAPCTSARSCGCVSVRVCVRLFPVSRPH